MDTRRAVDAATGQHTNADRLWTGSLRDGTQTSTLRDWGTRGCRLGSGSGRRSAAAAGDQRRGTEAGGRAAAGLEGHRPVRYEIDSKPGFGGLARSHVTGSGQRGGGLGAEPPEAFGAGLGVPSAMARTVQPPHRMATSRAGRMERAAGLSGAQVRRPGAWSVRTSSGTWDRSRGPPFLLQSSGR